MAINTDDLTTLKHLGQFATKANSEVDKAFKSAAVNSNRVSFYTTSDTSGTAAFAFDFPESNELSKAIEKPVQDGTVTYNGVDQSPCWLNYVPTKMTISGVTHAINAGKYTAIFTPVSGYVWSDGTTGAISVEWKIQKAASAIHILQDAIAFAKDGTTYSLGYSVTGDGVFSATSSDTSIATVAINKSEVILSKVSEGRTTVKLELSEGENYTSTTRNVLVTTGRILDIYTIALLSGENTSWIDETANQWEVFDIEYEPKISTDTYKFDESAIYFYHRYEGLKLENIALGGKDFTVDFWFIFKNSSGSGYQSGILSISSPDLSKSFVAISNDRGYHFIHNAYYHIGSYAYAGGFSQNQWYHIAIVYSHSESKLYYFNNGTAYATYSGTTQRHTNLTVKLGSGSNKTYDAYYTYQNLYMDNVRISDGIARWTSKFTPPTAEDYE